MTPPLIAAIDALSLLDQIDYSVLVTDREGRIEYVNQAFERASGYSRDEVIGQTPRILKSGVHPPEAYERLWRTILRGESTPMIFANRRKDGEIYEEAAWISIIRDADGAISHFVSLGRLTGQSRGTFHLFSYLAEHSTAGVVLLRDGKFLFTNAEYQRITGYGPKELLGRDRLSVVLPEDQDYVQEAAHAMLAGKRTQPYEFRILRKNGEIRWVLNRVTNVDFLLQSSVGQGRYVFGTVVDITDRKAAEDRLKGLLSMYAATIESTTDAIAVVDTQQRMWHFNTKYLDIWGATSVDASDPDNVQALLQHTLDMMVDPQAFARWGQELLESGARESTTELELKDGRLFEVYAKPHLIDGEMTGRVWSFRDVTERRRVEAELRHLANYDTLTGLLNRRRFQEIVEETIGTLRGGEHAALLLMDVDRFKDVNDSLGHQAGDLILSQLGDVLRSVFASHTVGRFGGEEFAVLIQNADADDAQAAAKKLATVLSRRRLSAKGAVRRITLSTGVAVFPDHGETASELFSHADVALYEAKYAGRNRVAVYAGRPRLETIPSLQDWRFRLQDSIDNKALVLLAQPLVAIADGGVLGYELLLRLRNERGALVTAKNFIPVAERLGLIQRIDEWVVLAATELLSQMQRAGSDAKLSVNLGGWAFSDPNMLDFLRSALRASGVRPSGLIVEMTETSALSDVTKARHFIETLRSMGCRFALDDFGVGYSSFDYLKRLPVDIVKIDGSFVRDLTHSPVSQEIVAAIVRAARGLGLTTVAESVHNEATYDAVRAMDVDLAQGYWLGRPRSTSSIIRDLSFRRAA